MPRWLAKTDLESAGGQNRISLDFCAHPSRGLPPFLPGVCPRGPGWADVVGRVETACRGENGDTWREVVEEIVSLSLRLGTHDDVIEKVRAAGRREAFFVVTGQQPGALGGPLLALYKASTAVAVAAVLENALSRPFVPLYWCGGDDTDFHEVRGLSLLTRNSTPISTTIAQQGHRPGLPVGEIEREWLDQVWKNIRPFVDEFENGDFVAQALDDAFASARDHGEHAAAVLVRLVGGEIAVVDGRSPAVRRHAQRVILEYLRSEEEIIRLVVDEGRRLERSGYHAQLAMGEDSGIFLVENGVRKNVRRDLRSILVEAARTAVERCSPGVVARNLVQDAVFKPVAVVLGPAEIAYRAQMGVLYGRFGIAVPCPVPRLTATFLSPALAEMVGNETVSAVTLLLKNPGEFARSVSERMLPVALRGAARELDRRVAEAADAFSRAVDTSAPPRAASRVKARIADLRNRSALAAASAAEVGRAIALERWPFLTDLVSLLKPEGKPQERSLSALVPFLFGGASAARDVRGVTADYVDDLLDGRASHIVYSSPK